MSHPQCRVVPCSSLKCFKYRLIPTSAQEVTLCQFTGCRRWVWNWALAQKQETYKATGKRLTYNALASELVDLKRQQETSFLKECHSQILQHVLMDLESAFKNFFERRAKFPRYKSKKRTHHAFRMLQNVTIVDGKVSIPKIGLVNAKVHRPLEGTVKSATVKQEASGEWYVTFVSHVEQPDIAARTANRPVGIDVGLKSFVTLDCGEKVSPPKF